MNYEMRVEEHSSPLVVFMHQMVPHHQNAVNMARCMTSPLDLTVQLIFAPIFAHCPKYLVVHIWH